MISTSDHETSGDPVTLSDSSTDNTRQEPNASGTGSGREREGKKALCLSLNALTLILIMCVILAVIEGTVLCPGEDFVVESQQGGVGQSQNDSSITSVPRDREALVKGNATEEAKEAMRGSLRECTALRIHWDGVSEQHCKYEIERAMEDSNKNCPTLLKGFDAFKETFRGKHIWIIGCSIARRASEMLFSKVFNTSFEEAGHEDWEKRNDDTEFRLSFGWATNAAQAAKLMREKHALVQSSDAILISLGSWPASIDTRRISSGQPFGDESQTFLRTTGAQLDELGKTIHKLKADKKLVVMSDPASNTEPSDNLLRMSHDYMLRASAGRHELAYVSEFQSTYDFDTGRRNICLKSQDCLRDSCKIHMDDDGTAIQAEHYANVLKQTLEVSTANK